MTKQPAVPVILVVDDTPEVCALLKRFLNGMAYHVEIAYSGEKALEWVQTNTPDLILLDVLMPEIDGYGLCRCLKQMPHLAGIPIIFMSALTDVESRVRGFEVGGVDYIPKPLQLAEVAARINTHIQLRQTQKHISKLNTQLTHRIDERTEQLNRLNDRMAGILGSVTDAILLLDHHGMIENSNRGFDTMFGYGPDELYGQNVNQIIHEAHLDTVQKALAQVQNGETSISVDIEGCCKDGSVIDMDLTFSRISRDPGHIVCTCHNITFLKEAERVKANFISMVTHELRTPIAALLLIASTMNKHYDRMSEEKRRSRVGHLYIQAKVLSELVESVLDIARFEARRGIDNDEPVDLVEVAAKVLNELSSSAVKKDIVLQAELPDDSRTILGDSVDMGRIWRNLINNAIKYTDEGGQVTVRVDMLHTSETHDPVTQLELPEQLHDLPPGHYVVGQVADTGHGFGPEDLDGLYTRFHRGWAKKSNIPGTGLGLALVKELLESYGGGIFLETELNKGSTFTFWIPMQPVDSLQLAVDSD